MERMAMGMAVLLAAAIMVIGAQYVMQPLGAARTFGLPLPDAGSNTPPWLRLKGVRDIAAGLVVLALLAWSTSRAMGIVLLALAAIPVGDMLVILRAKGSRGHAYGMHGVTAVVMVLTAVALVA